MFFVGSGCLLYRKASMKNGGRITGGSRVPMDKQKSASLPCLREKQWCLSGLRSIRSISRSIDWLVRSIRYPNNLDPQVKAGVKVGGQGGVKAVRVRRTKSFSGSKTKIQNVFVGPKKFAGVKEGSRRCQGGVKGQFFLAPKMFLEFVLLPDKLFFLLARAALTPALTHADNDDD